MGNELIPKTYNLIELYFKTTLHGYLKRRYNNYQRIIKKTKKCKNMPDSENILDKLLITYFFNFDYIKLVSP